MDLGATEWTTFRKITLPMIAPGVAAAALLASAISIDDYVITSFNAGQTQTFPLFIFGATRQGVPPEVNVLASALLFVVLILMGLNVMLQRRLAARVAAAARRPTRPTPRRSRPPVPSRTGLVFDERCFGHRNPPAGPPWLPIAAVRAARAARRDVPGARGLGRARQGRARAGAQRPADRARARPRRQPRRARARRAPRHRQARPRGVDRAGHAHRRAARGRRPARGGGGAWWRASCATRSCSRGRPGHHAEAARPMGFCLLNATAVAARWVQLARGAARVAILDWDVHHGNGTEAIFRDDASVLTISLHQDALYPVDTGDVDAPGEALVNVPLPAGTGDAGYALAFERVVEPAIRAFAPDLLLIGAGQDAAATRPAGPDGGHRARLPRVDRPRGRAGRRVLRRAPRRLPRGRLLAAPPARRQPRDPRGARRAAAELRESTRSAATSRRGLRDVERAAVEAARVKHDAHGWWIAEAGAPPALPALAEELDADVVIVGGGYTGMWTAWEVARARARRARRGPRGGALRHRPERAQRRLPLLAVAELPADDRQYGERRARELCEASAESVDMVGAWCARAGGRRLACARRRTSSSPAPRPRTARAPSAVDGDEVVALTPPETRAVCDSPVFRGGVATRSGATVHPARLAFGLARAAARPRRADLRGLARAPRCTSTARGGVVAETAGGRVRAGAAAVAINAASGQVRRLRDRLTVSSSHIVLTEPVPDVIEAARLDGRRGDHRRARAAALLPHHPRRAHPARLGRRADGGGRAHGRARGARPRRRRADAPGRCCGSSRCSRAAGSSTPGAGRSTSPPRTCRRSSRSRAAARGRRSATPATASGRRTWPAARSPRSRSGAPRTRRAGRGSTRRRRSCRPSRCASRAPRLIRAALAAQGGGGGGRRARRSGHAGARGDPFDDRTAHRALICR